MYADGAWRDWKDEISDLKSGLTGPEASWQVDNFSIKVYGVPVKPASEYLPGDLNRDGVVNAKDITLLRRYVAGGYGVELS